MFVEHDACVGARLVQVRVAGDVTTVTTITARYHERTGYLFHRSPKSGDDEPEGEAAEERDTPKGYRTPSLGPGTLGGKHPTLTPHFSLLL